MAHIYFQNKLYNLTDSTDRYFLHDDVDELVGNLSTELFQNGYEDDELVLFLACKQAHKYISSQHAHALSTIELEGVTDTHTFTVVEKSLEKILKENGYTVEKSLSGSLYVTVDDKQIRLADHKRPAFVDGFASYEHEYNGGQLISKTGTFTKKELASAGITLNNNETLYYL